MPHMIAAVFKDQTTLDIFAQDTFYAVAVAALFLAAVALAFVDAGGVRRKNLIDTWVQKLGAMMIAGGCMMIVGYGIWEWQFNQAFGVANPLGEALKGWWVGGTNYRTLAQNLDPALVPAADVLQIFGAFFFTWAAVFGALIHSAGLERVKAAPTFIIAAVGGGIVMPILAYLTWGSAGPLTNAGLHDFLGVYTLYILVGTWTLILAWRAGPRRGVQVPHNLSWTAAGVGIFLFAIPLAILGCGYFVPGEGYFGISMASSSIGIIITNVFVSYFAGTLGGLIIAYRTKNAGMALLGPIAGYIACASAYDVYHPWEAFIVAFFGPFAVYLGMRFMRAIKVDEGKVVALTLFGGIYGVVVSGFFAWHTKVGGFFGITEGKYAFQNAEVTPWMQILGVVIVLAIAGVTGLILVFALEKTIGLRVTAPEEDAGLDATYWGLPDNDTPDLLTPPMADMVVESEPAAAR
jgi:Amt family ammonium transporter